MRAHPARSTLRNAAALLGAALLLAPAAPRAQDRVQLPSLDADLTGGKPTELSALLYRPRGDGPFAAIVMMHGCGGLINPRDRPFPIPRDWAERMRDQGYVALLVDSFTPRGIAEACTQARSPIAPGRERARDAYAALRFLQGTGYVRGDRIGLMGWSQGGSTVLGTVAFRAPARALAGPGPDFAAAIALYPGCGGFSDRWTTGTPLLMLIGEADDWTAPGPCKDLQRRAARLGAPVDLIAYPDAHHAFDAPDLPLRTREGITRGVNGRSVTLGTNMPARQDAIRRATEFFRAHLLR